MSIIEKISQAFATYLSLKDQPRGKIVTPQLVVDPSLQSLIATVIETDTQASKEDWSRCFLKSLLEAQQMYQWLWVTSDRAAKMIVYSGYLFICQNGLFCYLQPSCWKAAKTVSRRLQQSRNSALHYSVEDCYLIACEFTCRPKIFLRRFDFTRTVPLEAYAYSALQQAVKDCVAKELKTKAMKFSGLGRLKNLSPSRLEKLLLDYGLRGEGLEQHRLLGNVFKQLWENLQSPSHSDGRHQYRLRIYSLSDQQLNQIAEGYKRQAQRLQWNNPVIDGARVKVMLETCLQAIQTNETQRSLSLEDLSQPPEATNISGLNPLDSAIRDEQQQDSSAVKQAVEKALGKLEKNAYQGLLLALGLEVHQSDLTVLLGVQKQYQVARQFQRYQRTILRELIQFYQSSSRKMSADAERDVLIVVKEYLSVYSKRFFGECLQSAIAQQLTPSEQQTFVRTIAQANQPTEDPRFTQLIQQFQTNIENQLNLQLEDFKSVPEKIEHFVTEWLEQNQAKFN